MWPYYLFIGPARSEDSRQPPPPGAAPAAEEDVLYSGMEEGVDARQWQPQPNPAAWKLFKIFFRSFTVMLSIALAISLFVLRHLKDPELQDPYRVVVLLFFCLIPVGFGFMITQGDVETRGVSTQGEAARRPQSLSELKN